MLYSRSEVWQIVLSCNSAARWGTVVWKLCSDFLSPLHISEWGAKTMQTACANKPRNECNAMQLVDFPPDFKNVLSVYIIYTGIFF